MKKFEDFKKVNEDRDNISSHELAEKLLNRPDVPVTFSVDIGDADSPYWRAFGDKLVEIVEDSRRITIVLDGYHNGDK